MTEGPHASLAPIGKLASAAPDLASSANSLPWASVFFFFFLPGETEETGPRQ
jgi:hypothetical protein